MRIAVLGFDAHGRIAFTPFDNGYSKGYSFEAPRRFDKLFSGVASPRPEWIDPDDVRGKEGIGPEDTGEADYGRLLERAERRLAERSNGIRPQGVLHEWARQRRSSTATSPRDG